VKNSTVAALTLAALTATLLACQAVTGAFATPTPTQPPPTPTPVDFTGTHWFIYYTEPGGTYYEYDLILHPGGRMENFHPNESTPNNDAWMQSGDTLVLLFNDAYATYEGQVVGDTVAGTATNIAGGTWTWEGYRLP
jgi:hypothetical protein